MAAFPPQAQIVAAHLPVYEAYYLQADPGGTGSIGALNASIFLKKSNLKDALLSQIWDLSDPTGKGYLEKAGFFVALKLIALSQSGHEVNMAKLIMEAPQPNLGPYELAATNLPNSPAGSGAWVVQAAEKVNYDKVFDSLLPVNGMLSGDKVKPILMNSKLPVDLLMKIWDLGDIDKDGYLDRDEFSVAMHLVYKARENEATPSTLPSNLVPPSKRKKGPPPGGVAVLPMLPLTGSGRSTPVQRTDSPVPGLNVPAKSTTWVVTPADKAKYDVMFKGADTDMDGFVMGNEVRDILTQSGLPNALLAHIWSLCDISGTGKLNSEQFALAMYLVQQRMKGMEPPQKLAPEMIPPSMQPKPMGTDPAAFGVMDATNAGPYSHVADFSAIKELDGIAKEIDDMKRDKMQLEKDKIQREADIKIRNGEAQILQKELDAITSTLHQLESQKKEAQKRLDELDDKRSNMQSNVKDLKDKCDEEQSQINQLNSQLRYQENSVKSQESDLGQLTIDLNGLRDQETSLERKVEAGKVQLESLSASQRSLQLQISQTSARVQHLQDQVRNANINIASYTSQLNGDGSSVGSADDNFSTRMTAGSSPVSTLSSFSSTTVDELKEDPFKSKDDPFNNSSDPTQTDPFQNDDPFKGSDPFKSEGFSSDPFASEDPFKDAFGGTPAKQADPFGNVDPFSNSFSSSKKSADRFDPFGGGGATAASARTLSQKSSGNLFDSDPFAPKAAQRSESPIPALPPKQKKPPPPRPAPPRPKASPSGPAEKSDTFGGFGSDPFANNDAFASSGASGNDPFSNFADFSPSKFPGDVSNDMWSTDDNLFAGSIDINVTKLTENDTTDHELELAFGGASEFDSEA